MKAQHRLAAMASCAMILASTFASTAYANPTTSPQFWRTLFATAQQNSSVEGEEWSLINLVRTLIPHVTGDTTAMAWADLGGTGRNYALHIEGGRLFARHEEGSILWENRSISARHIRAIQDLDLNGAEEIVVEAENGLLHIINGRNGHSMFTSHAPGSFWIQESTDEASPVFLFLEQNASSTLTAYHFPEEDTAEELWTLESLAREPHLRLSRAGTTPTIHVLDLEGNLLTLQTETGNPLEEETRTLSPMSNPCNLVVPLVEDGNKTLVLSWGDENNGPGWTVTHADGSAHLEHLIQWAEAPPTHLRATSNPVADLDGDGSLEIFYTVTGPPQQEEDNAPENQHELRILNLTTGQVITHKEGLHIRGVLEVHHQKQLLTQNHQTKTLEAWSFDGQELQQVWSIPHADVLAADPSLACTGPTQQTVGPLLRGDLDDDGSPEYILERTLRGDSSILQSLTLVPGVPEILGQRPLSPGQALKIAARQDGLFLHPRHLTASFGEGQIVELGPGLEAIRTLERAEAPDKIKRYMPLPSGPNPFQGPVNFVAETPEGQTLVLSSNPHAEQKILWRSSENAWFSGTILETSTAMLFLVGEEIEGQKQLTAIDGLGRAHWALPLESAAWPRDLTYLKPSENAELFLYRRNGDSPSIEVVASETGERLASFPLSLASGSSEESVLRILSATVDGPSLLLIHNNNASILNIQSNGTITPGDLLPLGSRALQSVANMDGNRIAIQREDGGRGVYNLDTREYLWQLEELAYNTLHPPVWGYQAASVAFVGAFGHLSIHDTDSGERVLALCADNGTLTVIPPHFPVDATTCDAAPLQRVFSVGPFVEFVSGVYYATDNAGNVYRITHHLGTTDDPEEHWTYETLSLENGFEKLGSEILTGPLHNRRRAEISNALAIFSTSAGGHAQVFQTAEPPVENLREHAPGQESEDADLLTDASSLSFSWDETDTFSPLFVLTSDGNAVALEEGTTSIQDLSPGIRYSAAIAPLNQTPALTDGAILQDETPPRITLTPDLEAALFSTRDLTAYDVHIELEDQGALRITRASLFYEASSDPLQTWVFPGFRFTEQEELLSWPLSEAADGEYMLFVTAEDFARQKTTESLAFKIDNTAPEPPEWTSPEPNGQYNPGDLVLEGSAEPASIVHVVQGTEEICTTTALNNGSFACDISLEASETPYTFAATATDEVGHTSEPSTLTFQVQEPPTEPEEPTPEEPEEPTPEDPTPEEPKEPTIPEEPTPEENDGHSRGSSNSSCTISSPLGRSSTTPWWASSLLMALFLWRRRPL